MADIIDFAERQGRKGNPADPPAQPAPEAKPLFWPEGATDVEFLLDFAKLLPPLLAERIEAIAARIGD